MDLQGLEKNIGLKFAGGSIADVINALVPYIFGLAGILVLLYLLYGGFHLILSMGEPKAVQEAKSKITNALVDFIIIFLAYWLVQIIGKILGLNGFSGAFRKVG